MWLYLGLVALVALAAVGIVAGGIFTIVLVPLAVIAAVSALIAMGMNRAAEARQGGGTEEPPLPHAEPSTPGHVRTTPERLADARRVQQ